MPRIKKIKVEGLKVAKQPAVEPVSESVVESEAQVPTPEPVLKLGVLPEDVLKKEIVDINGKRYNKFWHKDNTTTVELVE